MVKNECLFGLAGHFEVNRPQRAHIGFEQVGRGLIERGDCRTTQTAVEDDAGTGGFVDRLLEMCFFDVFLVDHRAEHAADPVERLLKPRAQIAKRERPFRLAVFTLRHSLNLLSRSSFSLSTTQKGGFGFRFA